MQSITFVGQTTAVVTAIVLLLACIDGSIRYSQALPHPAHGRNRLAGSFRSNGQRH